jgi:hypothetical protein
LIQDKASFAYVFFNRPCVISGAKIQDGRIDLDFESSFWNPFSCQ